MDAARFRRLDRAFRDGDLDALRSAVDDPAAIPSGPMPVGIGDSLTYAIYWSPLRFIRQLLELGANPSAPADDGFPPLIAALSCGRTEPGANHRTDVNDIVRLLLAFGADPNQRGVNDWTALHMAVAERNGIAVQLLLDAGADPGLRTRIDDCETPMGMAERAGLAGIASVLARHGQRHRLRAGVFLLADVPGTGEPVQRQHNYRIRLRMRVQGGEDVRWTMPWGPVGAATLEDDGATLLTEVRIDRRSLANGIFYGVEGMRVGGLRRLEIAPHMAYGSRGVPGIIPANATLIAEIEILEGPLMRGASGEGAEPPP